MNANPILLQKKHANVIDAFAASQKITRREAMHIYYSSELYHLVNEGVSDMHCRSELYLAQELADEVKNGDSP